MTSKNCFQTKNDTLSINDALFQKSTLISSDEVDTVPEQVNRDDFKDILTSNEEKIFQLLSPPAPLILSLPYLSLK